ncbi:MAG TPA: hypothetical protein VNO14_17630 [Blastocatellia bacterium]|jgi:hypothetical protein|nr:hypothetical protein [Blastocatellia bacterium]
MKDLTHKMAAPAGPIDLEMNNDPQVSQLKAIYDLYGGRVYSLCLRLLASEKAAESATVDVFVRFGKEMARQEGEAHTFNQLRELAISASLARLRCRTGAVGRRLMRKARRTLLKVLRSEKGERA